MRRDALSYRNAARARDHGGGRARHRTQYPPRPASAVLLNGNPQLRQSGGTMKFSAVKHPAQNWPCAEISAPQHGQCGGNSTSSTDRKEASSSFLKKRTKKLLLDSDTYQSRCREL
jgi:hypothetical protein